MRITIDYGNITKLLTVPVTVTNCYTGKSGLYSGILDTGATNAIVSRKVFSELHLVTIGQRRVIGVNSDDIVNVTWIDILLRDEAKTDCNIRFEKCRVPVCNIGFDVIIGMDILTRLDFTMQNRDKTIISMEFYG